MVKLADTMDLKSFGRMAVRVRVPLQLPIFFTKSKRRKGGKIVTKSLKEEIVKNKHSFTGEYLNKI